MKAKKDRQDPAMLALFGGTLFLSAGLMFAIQPMAGKALLPVVGGTPAGWIVAMAFFQVMLLLGYLYAHFLSRFPPLTHALLYIAALGFGCLFLPFHVPDTHGATLGPFDVFRLLTVTLAVPFIALSATSSTLQRLFTATGHAWAQDPYFLYAASNLGSFTGLFLYPLAFERLWGLSAQSHYWLYGYALLIAAGLLCMSRASGEAPAPHKGKKPQRVANRERLEWIALAFFPSALLLAVTTHISTDIFSAPMLWVLPLSLYLLTFVAAFGRRQLLPLASVTAMQPVAAALALGFLMMLDSYLRVSWRGMIVHLVAFTITALMCHMRLAGKRPLKDGRRLTEFYLMIAVGGALGGILNAFVAPLVLNRLLEYPVLLILSCAVNPVFEKPLSQRARVALGVAAALAAFYIADVIGVFGDFGGREFGGEPVQAFLADAVLFIILLASSINARALLCGGLVMLFIAQFITPTDELMVRRNFYGVIKVFEAPLVIKGRKYAARYLYHGTTTHGIQIEDKKYETTPTAYFTRSGPAGDVFNLYAPEKIAVIGLGAGTLNCYSTPKNEFTFFEIDPAIIDVASDPKYFTFLSACKGRRPPRIITGDGRLELAKLDEKFDLIVLDAFSSDTIPAHLLTTDAVKVYLDHLSDHGLMLMNLSNRYFNLAAEMARNAEDLGLKYRIKFDDPDDIPYASASLWFAMAPPGASMTPLDALGWVTPVPSADLRPWTDDYTNLLSVFQVFRKPVKNAGR